MTFEPRRNRRAHDGEPVTASEVARWQERHEEHANREHRDFRRMIERLDERTDKLTTRVAVIFAVSSVLWAIVVVLAPFLRAILGIPDG